MEEKNIQFANALIKDVRTYMLMSGNQNYRERLKEAYDHVKSIGIKDYNDFNTREDLLVGAFGYDEITIFDRLKNNEYYNTLANAASSLNVQTIKPLIDDKTYGDKLASWGKLGKTPYRENLINKGVIVNGLTEEEQARHFR